MTVANYSYIEATYIMSYITVQYLFRAWSPLLGPDTPLHVGLLIGWASLRTANYFTACMVRYLRDGYLVGCLSIPWEDLLELETHGRSSSASGFVSRVAYRPGVASHARSGDLGHNRSHVSKSVGAGRSQVRWV